MDVALATCAALPGLASDDRHLLAALRRQGVEVEPAVWEDPHFDWSAVRACVVRSAWDYAYRRQPFVTWAHRVGSVTALWNAPAIVEWNTHKRYLVDLHSRGVAVVPTEVLPAGTRADLAGLLAAAGWRQAVLKAAVAQTGRYLLRVDGDASAGQRHLERLLPHEDMLLQPYLPTVAETGELSLVFIEGEFSHAVRKQAVSGDFRVHDDFGGSVEREDPTAVELDVARAAIGAVGEPLLYGRVDLVLDGSGDPVVMELELVEPELYFRSAPESADRLARAIAHRVTG